VTIMDDDGEPFTEDQKNVLMALINSLRKEWTKDIDRKVRPKSKASEVIDLPNWRRRA